MPKGKTKGIKVKGAAVNSINQDLDVADLDNMTLDTFKMCTPLVDSKIYYHKQGT